MRQHIPYFHYVCRIKFTEVYIVTLNLSLKNLDYFISLLFNVLLLISYLMTLMFLLWYLNVLL